MRAPPRLEPGRNGVERDRRHRETRAALALSSSVAFPSNNVAGSLTTDSTLAVIEGGRIKSATVDDIGSLIGGGGGGGGLSAAAVMARCLGC